MIELSIESFGVLLFSIGFFAGITMCLLFKLIKRGAMRLIDDPSSKKEADNAV